LTIDSNVILATMASRSSTRRPLRNAALPLSVLHLLVREEPCVAFRQLHTTSSSWAKTKMYSPLSLRASIGDLPDTGKSLDEESNNPITSLLVDRSSVYIVNTSPDSVSDNLALNFSIATNSSLNLEDEEELCFLDGIPVTDAGQTCFNLEDEEELCFLDDISVTDAGQTCFVSDSSSLSSDDNSLKILASLPFNTRIPPTVVDLILKYLPFIMPVIAYFTYEPTAKIFNGMVEIISSNNWVAVDGGQYQATIITPAINGLIVPSIALLFATLMSNNKYLTTTPVANTNKFEHGGERFADAIDDDGLSTC
jgi:hypothetical protein